jgi:predicted GIY-YIG superfamily endonuclease
VQHKDKIFKSSFTAKYNINKIVYYEVFGNVYNAIAREKQIKGWIRKRKVELIKGMNPEWKDFMIDMLPLPCQDPALSDKPRDPSLRSG